MADKNEKIKCACGCIVKRSELVRVYVKKAKKVCCPNHSTYPEGKWISKICYCVDCGIEFEASLRATKVERCKKHQKQRNKEKDYIRYDKYRKKPKIEPELKQKIKKFHWCSNVILCGYQNCIKPYFECKMFKENNNEIQPRPSTNLFY